MSQGDVQLAEHFMLHEAKSPDSDKVLVSTELVEKVEQLRSNIPNCAYIILSSGYRTDAESIRVGGNAGDPHTQGKAWDLACFTSDNQIISGEVVCCVAQDLGFNGIGYMGNWIHLDVCDRHWWGDEIQGGNVGDWYNYFGLSREIVPQPEPVVEPTPEVVAPTVSIDDIVAEVLRGDWGNGQERFDRLTAAGYNANEIQCRVNSYYESQESVKPEGVEPEVRPITVGDKVRVLDNVNYDNGEYFAMWYDSYDVIEIDGERAVIGVDGVITAPINVSKIELV